MSLRRWIYSMIVPVALASVCRADQVSLSNGDRVTGKLMKKDGENLTVKTDLMGEVTIAWKSVLSVSTRDPMTVVLTNGQSLVGPVNVDTAAEKLEVATAASLESAPLSDLVSIRNEETQKEFERMEKPGILDLWAGSVDLGLSAARGNARTNTFTISSTASRETRTDKTAAYFSQIYSSALVDGVSAATAEAIRSGWSYTKNASPRLLVNLFNDYEYDHFQNLDLRVVLGGGLGYTIIKGDSKRLDLLGGAAYNREQFSTPEIRNSAEAYWGGDFSYRPSRITEFQQKFRIFHNLSDPGTYRVNVDMSGVVNLNHWLAWHLTISDRLLSEPVEGRQHNDVLYTTGLRLRFAR